MFKFSFVALALASVAAPTFAAAETTSTSFTRDGHDYVATVHRDGAAQVIEGKEVNTGSRFRLRVANGRVTGDYAGTAVAYRAPAAAVIQTASY